MLLKSLSCVVVALSLSVSGRAGEAEAPAPADAKAALPVAVPAADTSRAMWAAQAERMAKPLLQALANNELRQKLPAYPARNRQYAALEGFGRLLAGIAPWLEQDRPKEMLDLVYKGLDNATNPESPDYMNWRGNPKSKSAQQPLVDASYVALALLRAPKALWEPLSPRVKAQVLAALRESRKIPSNHFNNWVLFSSTLEAALHRFGGDEVNRAVVQEALDKMESWYVGDGTYKDGNRFHWDYYNSYVMHPMYLATLRELGPLDPKWAALLPVAEKRAARYATVQEEMISPEGTFPVVGRSSVYRTAAFQTLADVAWQGKLPKGVSPAQVRCALSAVLHRIYDYPGTYDENGWLTLGLCGKQPKMEDGYNSAGSAYIAANVFLPLGLPPTDPFWKDPDEPWTQAKVWSGANIAVGHAQD